MADGYDADEEGLAERQGAALYPVGRAFRATFDADNHASLSAEVTALMLNLSRVPYEPCAETLPVVAVEQPAARSLLARVRTLLRPGAA